MSVSFIKGDASKITSKNSTDKQIRPTQTAGKTTDPIMPKTGGTTDPIMPTMGGTTDPIMPTMGGTTGPIMSMMGGTTDATTVKKDIKEILFCGSARSRDSGKSSENNKPQLACPE